MAQAPKALEYAIVIASKNRLEALRASVPLFLSQSRRPARIIVVDRSDDHAAVQGFLAEQAALSGITILCLWGTEANSAAQRNQGLDLVTEPVTIMPDDDSLWFPETAARIMAVYEADAGGRIGGVAGWISPRSPLAQGEAPQHARRFMRRPWIEARRNKIEARFAPQPFNLFAQKQIGEIAAMAAPPGARITPTMSGWRMSYRTELAQRLRFDPLLGRHVGYALHEDKDLSLRVQAAGHLLVAAEQAPVFHNVHPGRRAGGFAYGFFWLFNYIYICRKIAAQAPVAWRGPLRRYMRYKAILYHLRRRNAYERDLARGARAALLRFDALWRAPDSALAATYDRLAQEALSAEASARQ